MPFPTNLFQVGAVVVLLLPGLVYALVRRYRKGFRPDDLTIDSRAAQALVVSVLLAAVYIAVGWGWLETLVEVNGEAVTFPRPVALGFTIFVGCAAVPAVLAWLFNMPYQPRRRREADGKGFPLIFERTIRSSGIPTAWDAAATRPHARMVRVQFPDGRWVGGFYGGGSFVSTYPQPRDIYISDQYVMNQEDGTFGDPVGDTEGVWLRIGDDHIVEFVTAVWRPEDLEKEKK